MTADIALADARDAVLRKIGRNVVNFQKMEGMLKFLNTQQLMNVSLKDIEKVLARARKVAAKQPMGRLAEAFVRSAYSNKQDDRERSSPKEISVTFSLRMDLDPKLAAERKKALRAVVAERNRLIHKWLASFDPNSLESCKTLGVALDEQHARVWPEFEALKAIVQAVREYHREVTQYLDSDSFLSDLKERIARA